MGLYFRCHVYPFLVWFTIANHLFNKEQGIDGNSIEHWPALVERLNKQTAELRLKQKTRESLGLTRVFWTCLHCVILLIGGDRWS